MKARCHQPALQAFKLPEKFPAQPWKKNQPAGGH